MQELNLVLDFATPAFLGNAEQVAQWRTPPIKALIRQWWRVVRAKACNFDHDRLLDEENALFGKAADKTATRSVLRMRLESWKEGEQKTWSEIEQISHPEVGGGTKKIGASLYLGYGPLNSKSGSTVLSDRTSSGKKRSAIAPGLQKTNLWLGFPDQYAEDLCQTIQLINWFGTIGSRSRNGWGSLVLDLPQSHNLTPKCIEPFTRPWSECLQKEWAHAIGKDSKGPLVWKTPPQRNWEGVMKALAEIKVTFRTKFEFSGGGPHPVPCKRHVLAYPITNHVLFGFGKEARLANQIRFKVMKENDSYYGIIVHLPCKAPEALVSNLKKNAPAFRELEKGVWPEVHAKLDQLLPSGRLS